MRIHSLAGMIIDKEKAEEFLRKVGVLKTFMGSFYCANKHLKLVRRDALTSSIHPGERIGIKVYKGEFLCKISICGGAWCNWQHTGLWLQRWRFESSRPSQKSGLNATLFLFHS